MQAMMRSACERLGGWTLDKLEIAFNRNNLAIICSTLAIFWIVAIINMITGGSLSSFGIVPRSFPGGMLGILTAPFIHSSLAHVAANTVPFFVLGTAVIIRGPGTFILTTVSVGLLCGLFVWGFGRPDTSHVGASSLVFGYVGFIITVAAFERNLRSCLIALGVLLLYGGMIIGMFPSDEKTSWEGHLFGFVSGGLVCYLQLLAGTLEDQYGPVDEKERVPILEQEDHSIDPTPRQSI